MPDSKKQPAKNPGKSIAKVFTTMVSDLSQRMSEAQHEFAVDVEINFKTVTLDSKGIPLFSKNTTQSQLEIKLASRIIPSAPNNTASTSDGDRKLQSTESKDNGHYPEAPL